MTDDEGRKEAAARRAAANLRGTANFESASIAVHVSGNQSVVARCAWTVAEMACLPQIVDRAKVCDDTSTT